MSRTTGNLFVRRDPLATLLLIRHGQTDYNREGRFYGRIDTPLNAQGETEARELAARLHARPVQRLYSSPALRARQTADYLSETLDLPVQTDELLWEMDHGRWEGLRFDEARALDPDLWERWRTGEVEAPHGGESLTDAMARARQWVDGILQQHPGETIAAVAHGGILQAMVCVLMGTPPRPLWQYRFGNATLAEIQVYPLGGVLLSFG